MNRTWNRAIALGLLTALSSALLQAAESPVNLARDKPSTASSVEKEECAANKANDGDTQTRWCADGGAPDQWWQVDLQKPSQLTGARITWEYDDRTYRYLLEGSPDAKTWTTLSDQKENSLKTPQHTLEFTAQDIRFVRLRITSLDMGTWASIRECQIFGTQP